MNNTTNNELTTRHDFSKDVRDFFNLAVTLGVVDAVELMVMGAEHGTDWRTMGDELLTVAFSGTHEPQGQTRHHLLVAAWDRLLGDLG